MNNKPYKKDHNRRTKFTIFAMFNIIWYTIVVLIATFDDHTVPSDLTVAWFSAWTVELALLFGIKINSHHDENSNLNNEEDTNDASVSDSDETYNNDIEEYNNDNDIDLRG